MKLTSNIRKFLQGEYPVAWNRAFPDDVQEFIKANTDFGQEITKLENLDCDRDTITKEMILFELKKKDDEIRKFLESCEGIQYFDDIWNSPEENHILRVAVSSEEGWIALVQFVKERIGNDKIQ